jgi:hypothetical protein
MGMMSLESIWAARHCADRGSLHDKVGANARQSLR